MSSPTDRTFDPNDPSPYAPRWVRDPAAAPRRRVSHPISTHDLAADHPPRLADAPTSRPTHDAPPIAGEPDRDEELVIDNFRVPRSLDPGYVPDPWPRRSGRTGMFSIVGRLAFAVSVAGLI